MPIYSLTVEQIAKLQKEHDILQAKLDELSATPTQKMWANDLSDIKGQLIKFEKNWNEMYAEILKTPQGIARIPDHLKKKITLKIPALSPQLVPLVPSSPNSLPLVPNGPKLSIKIKST
jgi:hypothetical protein